MSTNDPASAERTALSSAPETVALAGENPSPGMFALPDPAVIARLANEFFAALPGNPENVGASVPARATAGDLPAVPFAPEAVQANPQALGQQSAQLPQSPAVPGAAGYIFDRTSPLNVAPSFASLNDAFSFPGVPGAQAMPAIPGMPPSTPGAPLTEAELRAIPASLGKVPAFAPGFTRFRRFRRPVFQLTFSIWKKPHL